ncbi:MAG: hypothetical protein HC892_14555 [Saprospiraceae bacterium]|nr:hypothetical protein [Saprospiraceae bacterium]
MKKAIILLAAGVVWAACDSDFVPEKESILGKWQEKNSENYVEFIDQQNARLVYFQGEQTDTMPFTYKFEPDSTPMHFDMVFKEKQLKGLHRFGILEFRSIDTFVVTSERGFEGSDPNIRPKQIDPKRQAIYFRPQ